MKVVVAPEAAAQVLLRKKWWRANRSKAPERFDQELAAALTTIAERPESFPTGRYLDRYFPTTGDAANR
jgi:hypothetical protein